MDRLTVKHWCASSVLAMVLGGFGTGVLAHPSLGEDGAVAIVTLKVGKDRAEVQRLVTAGYDVAGVDLKAGTVDVVVKNKQESVALNFLGYEITDSKDVDQRFAPDANYHNPAEIEAELRRYAEQYPGLVRMESIGKSSENRDIWALKITDEPDLRELDEPTILFNSMHHAREIMTPEVALDTIDYLVTRYGTDAQVTKWVESTEIWVVPMLNVDGNNKVWNGSSMWRKNTRGGYGVDINRNYPYAWNACGGSSGMIFADDYRGPSAGSEFETQALMGLVSRIQPVFNISYHSYSELVIYPYGCSDRRVETKEIVEPIGREIAGLLPGDSSGHYDPGTAWELLYDVDGGDIDWMYNVEHVIPFVIELNSTSLGFQPAYRHRQPTVEKMRAAWTLLLAKLEGSGVRGVVTDGAGRTQPGTIMTVQGLGQSGANVAWEVKRDGTYHVVLNPGMYRLTFALGGRSVSKEVTVGESRVDMDVQL